MGVKRYDSAAGCYVRVDPLSGEYLDDELPAHVAEISSEDAAGEERDEAAELAEIDGLSRQERKAFEDAFGRGEATSSSSSSSS